VCYIWLGIKIEALHLGKFSFSRVTQKLSDNWVQILCFWPLSSVLLLFLTQSLSSYVWNFNNLIFCLNSRRWFVLYLFDIAHLVLVLVSEIRTSSIDWAQLSRSYLKTDKGMVRSDMSKPALIFFSARVHTTKYTVKILAANTHCKHFLKIAEVTHFFCTRNRLYQRFVQPS
jgi:hypothetical protein